jgi:uncharacterized protein (DUF697 family)
MPVLTNPKQRKKEAEQIINGAARNAGIASFGGGIIPGGTLVTDALLTGVTIDMVIRLGKLFGRSLNPSSAQSILTVVGGMVAGKTIANAATTFVPGFASFVALGTSYAFHQTAGWIVYNGFEEGRW